MLTDILGSLLADVDKTEKNDQGQILLNCDNKLIVRIWRVWKPFKSEIVIGWFKCDIFLFRSAINVDVIEQMLDVEKKVLVVKGLSALGFVLCAGTILPRSLRVKDICQPTRTTANIAFSLLRNFVFNFF